MYELVEVTKSNSGVAWVTLAHGKVNALSQALLTEIAEAFDELQRDASVRVVVLTGGPKLFAAGADISEFTNPDSTEFEVADALVVTTIGTAFHTAAAAIESLAVPTIAAVSGFALGGGCEVALACDLRIASERAVFGQPEILLGIIPGGGGTQRLSRLVGLSRAKELVLTGRTVDANEALQIGLVNRVVSHEEFDEKVAAFAESLALGAPHAQVIAKRVMNEGFDQPLSEALQTELAGFVEVFDTDDATIGVDSFQQSGPGKADFTGISRR